MKNFEKQTEAEKMLEKLEQANIEAVTDALNKKIEHEELSVFIEKGKNGYYYIYNAEVIRANDGAYFFSKFSYKSYVNLDEIIINFDLTNLYKITNYVGFGIGCYANFIKADNLDEAFQRLCINSSYIRDVKDVKELTALDIIEEEENVGNGERLLIDCSEVLGVELLMYLDVVNMQIVEY